LNTSSSKYFIVKVTVLSMLFWILCQSGYIWL